MKKIFTLLTAVFFLNNITTAQQTYTLDSTVLTSRTVISGIDIPWEIIWGPDDHIWMTERYGRVSRLNPVTGTQDVILNLSSQIYQQNESGLLGMLLHPNFSNEPYVYLVYTYQSSGSTRERLVKYTYNGSILNNPQILIDNITANSTHDGSRLLLLPDSTFLMTTGDAQATSSPQNTSSLNGKILRFNLDGSIPADNPNPNSYVYSWGHRNAQGLCLGPNNTVYCSEHGPTTDDELQIVHKAGNYGWPTVAGFCNTTTEINFCNDSTVTEPLVVWTPTIAPSDMIWYNHPSIPEFNNKLIMTVLKNKRLIAFGFNQAGDSVIQQSNYLVNQLRRLRDICVSPDGKIYLATNGDSWSNTNPFTHTIVELRNAAYVPSAITESSDIKFRIWPNPVLKGQQLNIEFEDFKSGTLKIYDLLGRPVFRSEFNGNSNFGIDLPSTLYIYNVETNDGQIFSGKLKID
jgi:glucose/arabinose dehydrogenase